METPTAAPIKKVGRKKDEVRREPAKRKLQVPFSPALEEWNLKVTSSSPLWLRSMAMKLG
jgi:hypothetical protein